jgi:hypothetical protein
MKAESIPFFRFAMNRALAHREEFQADTLPKDRLEYFQALAAQSVRDQQATETAYAIDFDTYPAALNAEYRDLL